MKTYLKLLQRASITVIPTIHTSVIKDDPDDDKFLSCALAGHVEFIVSGDHHLLNLQEYQGIRIVTPTTFLTLLEKEKPAA